MTEESYRLTPVQQGMLLHSSAAPESGAYFQQMVCTWRKELDISAFRRAWREIVARHPVLRTSFNLTLATPLQEVHRNVEVPLLYQDWNSLSEKQAAKLLHEFLIRDRRQGFQQDRPPLLRHAIFRFPKMGYRWVWSSHHALLDGRSRLLLLKEFFALYDGFLTGSIPCLEKPHPYRQFVDWLCERDFALSEPFWRNHLSGVVSPTPLSIQGRFAGRVVSRDFPFAEKSFWFSERLTRRLGEVAERCGWTVNTFLQGAWALLLSRYSGERQVVFGATRAGRHGFPGAASVIGPLINTVPLRVDVDPSSRVCDWLEQLRLQWIGFREHEHTPLVTVKKCSEIPPEKALFESLVTFENYQLDAVLHSSFGKSETTSFRLIGNTNYPLSLTGTLGRQLLLKIIYDQARFDACAMNTLLGHLQVVLHAMLSKLESRVSEISPLSEAARSRILSEWNDTTRCYPRDRCFHELFEEQVARTPDNVAIAYGNRRLTYIELNQRANQVAHRLRKVGAGPERSVAIYAIRSPEIIVAMLGILKAGAAYVPLNPGLPDEQLSWVIRDAQPLSVIAEEKYLTRVCQLLDRVNSVPNSDLTIFGSPECRAIGLDAGWQVVAQESTRNMSARTLPEDLAYVIYTSGSTGKPKGTMIEHRSLVNYLNWFNQSFLPENDVVVPATTSLAFDASLKQVLAPLVRGCTVWLISDELAKDPRQLIDITGEHEKVGFNCVPSFWRVVLDELSMKKPQFGANVIKYLFLGGEPASMELVDETLALMPRLRIWNLYGPTEATANVSWSELKSGRNISIGRPVDNVRTYVLDQNLEVVPVGVPGELHIGGIALARGYLKQPELTADRFVPDPFSPRPGARLYKTGDVVRYRSDGSVEFIGRLDDQIKIRGFRVELQEIETILKQYPAVQNAVVLPRNTPDGRQELVAYTVPGQSIDSVGDVRSFMRRKLPDYAVPSFFKVLDAMPLNSFGKVDRHALARMGLPVSQPKYKLEPPRTATELTLARIWCEVLGIDSVNNQDNFFELGGHSLLVTRMISRVRDRLQIELPVQAVFENTTLAALAAAVDGIRGRTGSAATPAIPVAPRRLQRLNLS